MRKELFHPLKPVFARALLEEKVEVVVPAGIVGPPRVAELKPVPAAHGVEVQVYAVFFQAIYVVVYAFEEAFVKFQRLFRPSHQREVEVVEAHHVVPLNAQLLYVFLRAFFRGGEGVIGVPLVGHGLEGDGYPGVVFEL